MSSPALVDLFLSAVAVDAPSLREAPMGDFVRSALAGLPLRLLEDAAGGKIGGTAGNLICIPDRFDPTRPSIALFAHLDTPKPTTGVRPGVTGDRIVSDGTTILGVDNRAGTSVLLDALRRHAGNPAAGNFVVVFTVGEELGMLGAKHVDLSPYNVRMGFVFDCSRRPGVYIRAAVGCSLYTATFHGRSSHAAVAPEKGVHAIRAAALALTRLPLGRIGPQMTANVGMIQGGTATNIIPDTCVLEGEVRSFSPREIDDHLRHVERLFQTAAGEMGATVETRTAVDFAPFVLEHNSPVVVRTEAALRAAGLRPEGIEYLGGSDANMLNAAGIPTANLGIGAQNPHGNDEFILLEDLDASSRIADALILGNDNAS